MILCIEVGNTAIKLGVFEADVLKKYLLAKTEKNKTADEYQMVFESLLKEYRISGAIISSVVPELTNIIYEATYKYCGLKPKILNRELKTKLPIKIDNPTELGSDFICTAIGALKEYSAPLIIADLGTATKLSVIDNNGSFIGGIITSGMNISLEALVEKTSQLIKVDKVAPKSIIGKNTKNCIQSGIVYGQAFMVSEFARRIEKELGYELNRVLTGGFAKIIKESIVCFNYEEKLSIEGLYEIYKINEEN